MSDKDYTEFNLDLRSGLLHFEEILDWGDFKGTIWWSEYYIKEPLLQQIKELIFSNLEPCETTEMIRYRKSDGG